jgi:hypothetical protein
MRRLSSRATFWYKRVFPVIWFAFIGVFIIVSLFGGVAKGVGPNLPFLIGPVLMIGFGYFAMKKLILDLVDEVDDDGDGLIVRNGTRSDRIAFSDVMNVSYSAYVNPLRVTLTLRKPSLFGDQVSFCAPVRFIPFAANPAIDDLIRRIDASRHGSRRAR